MASSDLSSFGSPVVLIASLHRLGEASKRPLPVAVLTKPVKHSQLDQVLRQVFAEAAPARVADPTKGATEGDERPQIEPQGLAILLVDDSPVNHKVGLRMLERLGYRADTVSDGLEAVAAVRSGSYDIVLMDVQMPVLDGLEATRRIRELDLPGGQPQIIAMTAAAMSGDEARCREVGMDDYITKPVRMSALKAALARATV